MDAMTPTHSHEAAPTAHYWRSTRNRMTRTHITVCHGDDEGLDTTDDGPWYTICDEHGSLCSHTTLALAKSHAADPSWCDECNAMMVNTLPAGGA